MSIHVDVIATTISGSIKDWGKVKRIVPLFKERGMNDVALFALDSHREAREKTCELISSGSRHIISAGGSGTFNSVLEGCCDSGIALRELKLGFLRKGSADLIGKSLVLKPDDDDTFPVNIDGSTMNCRASASFEVVNQLQLLSPVRTSPNP